jgi:hypothetical protein
MHCVPFNLHCLVLEAFPHLATGFEKCEHFMDSIGRSTFIVCSRSFPFVCYRYMFFLASDFCHDICLSCRISFVKTPSVVIHITVPIDRNSASMSMVVQLSALKTLRDLYLEGVFQAQNFQQHPPVPVAHLDRVSLW